MTPTLPSRPRWRSDMLTLIAARDRNGAIGKNNDIPWRAPEDLAFFQRETTGGAIVMGRRTWESLPFKPLKNRLNLIVSSDPDVAEHVCPTPQVAVEQAYAAGHRRVYGIGGAHVYRALLPQADRLLLTEVDLSVPGADTFFPGFDAGQWHCAGSFDLRDDAPRCTLFEYLLRH